MNKIYKVIWSKVRNCYVAVSEIAKRTGKSCTSVNCGAKANRGHAGMALALVAFCAVPVNAMAANSGGNADGPSGQEYIGFSPYEVTIDSGWGGDVYGRKESESDAKSAKVTISAGTVTYTVYGGYSASGDAGGANEGEGNSVTINGGTVNNSVYGGYTNETGSAQNNTVTISGTSTIGIGEWTLAGGKANGSGDATGNSVIVKGGTVNEKIIFGGNSSNGGNATNNKVIISGGTIKHNSSDVGIYGGSISSGSTNVTGNIVTLAGGEFSSDSSFAQPFFIVGGKGTPSSDSSTINNNTVNLYGNVEGLGPANLFGAFFGNTSIYKTGADNELHIGGVKDNAMLAADKSVAPWTGTEGNKVNMVRGFNSIVLHKVNWSPDTDNTTGTPVLAAKSFSNIGILDISGMDIQGTKTFETMTLLQSDNAPFANLTLTYIDATNQKQSDKPIGDGLVLKPFSNFGTDISKDGVTVAYDGAVKVTRPTDNKSIKYSISQEYTGATLGAIYWGNGYTFANGAVIKTGGLAVTIDEDFAVTDAADQENGQSFNLLDLSATTGTIKNAVSKGVTVTLADAAVAEKLTLSRERTDTATANAGGNQVVYTTGANDNVIKATFGAGINWNTTTPYYTHPTDSLYKFGSSTGVDASDLSITFTEEQKATLKKDDSMTLLSASGITTTNTVTQPTSNTVAVSNTSALGTQFGATATGTVAAETGAVKYKISSVDVNTITLGSLAWGSTDSLPETWTASGNTTVDASLFTFTGKAETALAIGNTVPILSGTGLGNSTVTNQPGEDYGKVTVDYTDTKGIKFDATAKGIVEAASNAVNYKVSSVTLKGVDLKNWDGTVASPTSAVPTGWTAQDGGVAVYTDNMTKLPTNLAPGGSVDILTGSAGFFVYDKIQGARKYQDGDAFTVKPNGNTGMVIAGNAVGGIKTDSTGAKLIYYAEKKSVSTITLGTATFANGGTLYGGAATEFTNEYDATGATITTDGLVFTNSNVMEAGDSMTILDASKAIKDGSGHALPAFTTQKTSFVVGFTDEVTDKGLTFKGTHTDTLSNDQTKMVYTVGNKVVSGDDAVALTGSITWNDSTPHYTNTKYTFDSTAMTNLSGLTFETVTTDPYGKSMTLISGNVAGSVSNAPASFGVSLAKTNTTLEATAAGSAVIDSGDLKYTVNVNGVTIDKINVKQVTDTAEVLPTGWVLKKSGSTIATTVETGTGTTAMTTPSGLNPGDTRVIFTAGESLEGITINGDFKWKEDNSDLPGTAENGVVITGKQTKGGVRVNTANTNQLIYEESKKNVTGISFSETTFVNGSTARSLDNNYDATGAAIDPDGLTFTEASRSIMETGNTMTMVDATAAIQNASNETLAQFNGGADKTYSIAFSDTITGKNLTLVGTHTDTLSQTDDTATSTKKSKLIYTVGAKNVTTATLSGDITWGDNSVYYENGEVENQNGVKPNYVFGSSSAINIGGVQFSATSDPLAGSTKSMTLLKGVTGVVATKVSGTPSFTVTLDQTNTKLDANATGSAAVSGSDVTYTVSGVAINKVNIKSVGSTADTVPANWTLASGATVETGNMTAPSGLTPGETKAIITATGTDYFNGIAVNGKYAWTSGGTITSDLDIGGVAIAGTQTAGGVKVDDANKSQLIYEESKKTVTGITLGEVTFAKDGTARAFDNTYDATAATINGDNLKFTEASAASMETGDTMTILDASAAFKSGGAALVAFADKSYTVAFSETNTDQNVTIAGTHSDTLSQDAAKTKLTYTVGTKDVNTVALGKVDFVKGSTLFDRSGAGYNYAGVAALGTDGFAVSYASPETVATGDSMTLLQANATLKDMAEQLKQTSYSLAPVSGVTIDATVTGSLEAKGGNVTYTATANQASKLTFGSVDWKDSGALMTRPSNITFAGADVDTTKIHFKNVKELDANKKMTLVSDFGDSVGTITGTKYTVGAGLEGEGAASLSGSDLVFTTKTGVKDLAAQEQTHNTLMVMEAGMAVLAAGNEYVGQTMAELGNPQNVSLDGTVTAASLGGSKSRYKTGSHVDSNNWNVAVAVGSKRELKKGLLEWGVFGEYGKSNYTLHSDAGRGDGDSHYAGGGLMAKWTNKHDVYTEASVRLGRLNDTASNLLRDAAGNGVGIGKIIHYKGGKSLDVYGKYFYTKRDGVDFTSGGNNYSLDSVASSILRVGARYGTTDKKWNWYGGLAYEYEFDGKSEGTVDGVGIRAASVKGGSVRGEIGLRMSATKTNPWQTDISIYGYGGKHRGFGGSVNVAYMF